MIKDRLFELRDEQYAAFQAKLTPGIDPDSMIGVRVPLLRKVAKEIYKSGEYKEFIAQLPHKYYDENILHSIVISEIKDIEECISEIERFLPYIDNWAVCDIMAPAVFKKHKERLMERIRLWYRSDAPYTCRFGLEMLMSHFLDDDFAPEYLKMPVSVQSEEYYVRMMVAWFMATALAKQWDSTITYLENRTMEPWTHNKTIQKAIESLRISKDKKEYLRGLKIK